MDSVYGIVKELIDFNSEGVDTYNHNGSTWLIFTDQKKWVIELTKEKTLWYNYHFFTGVFKYLSLDVVENQHYITKWVEDNVINGVKDVRALEEWVNSEKIVDKTIQNAVKHTEKSLQIDGSCVIEDTIQNGVKKTKRSYEGSRKQRTKDTIQNGVKVTYSDKIPREYDWSDQFTDEIEDIIENGVKHTEYGDWEDGDERLNDIIENGVKETTPGGYLGFVEMKGKKIHQFETAKQLYYVEDVIEGGIKKTEGGMLFDESKIDRVISEGVKETHDDVMPHTGRVKGVIKNGVKQCIPSHTPLYNPMDFSVEYRENHRTDDVASVLDKGIKETKSSGSNFPKWADEVIVNGTKNPTF